MRIGIDIDGVLTNIEEFLLDYFSRYCVLNHISYSIRPDNICYDLTKIFGITKEQEEDFWRQHIDTYATKQHVRPFAKEVLERLRDEGNEIYIITARLFTNLNNDLGARARKMVEDWLKQNGIIYDQLIFVKSNHESKIEEILDNKIEIMIEDNPHNIEEISHHIPVICYDATYNRNLDLENMIRCYSWFDIYRRIKER